MGGPGAPDDLDAGSRTQVWLAVSGDPAARVSGKYFYHLRPRSPHPAVFEVERQEKNYSMHATAFLAFVCQRERVIRRHSLCATMRQVRSETSVLSADGVFACVRWRSCFRELNA
jgi:hypothetical protein